MPSEKRRNTYLLLDNEERAHRSSSSTEVNNDENENLSIARPRWEQQRSVVCQTWQRRSNSVWFHIIFTIANLVLFGFAIYANKNTLYPSRRSAKYDNSIFRDSIHFETRYFNVRSVYSSDGTLNRNKSNVDFSGPPRPELEEAWNNILDYQNFRVQEDELGEFKGQKSLIKLSDDSGYYMTVAVQHALHCVQRLHRYMYKDHYHAGLSDEDAFTLKQHTEHCLDWLRQYVQCNADTTLIPIRWAVSVPGPVSKDWGKHQCVAWEPLVDFMASRAFDPLQLGLLVHPTFGNPYANDEGAHTGAVSLHGDGLYGGDEGPDV
ncbi:hypothetical protein GGI35DRAFT_464019 [Trichoderma velutinum]